MSITDSDILYRRTSTGKYIAVNDPWADTGLRDGHWHIWVRPSSTTTQRLAIQPYEGRESVAAALLELETQLVTLFSEACKARPSSTVITPKQKRAWDRFIKDSGGIHMFSYQSMSDMAKQVVDAVKERSLFLFDEEKRRMEAADIARRKYLHHSGQPS